MFSRSGPTPLPGSTVQACWAQTAVLTATRENNSHLKPLIRHHLGRTFRRHNLPPEDRFLLELQRETPVTHSHALAQAPFWFISALAEPGLTSQPGTVDRAGTELD